MADLFEDFLSQPDPRWQRHVVGNGALEPGPSTLRFVNEDTSCQAYTNAQIDDYQGRPRRHFPWRPPLTLEVRARFSHPAGQLSGTAGFGFWNDPFMMTGWRLPTLPQAIWFFYASPPSNMKLAVEAPGWGWKAATIDAWRWPFLLLAPIIPLTIPWMRVQRFYQKWWPIVQRAMGVCEKALDVALTTWHLYRLEWGKHSAVFSVDGTVVLSCAHAPRGPLGFVAWLDNQYAVVTPWGKFRMGRLAAPGRQWMEIDWISIRQGSRELPAPSA